MLMRTSKSGDEHDHAIFIPVCSWSFRAFCNRIGVVATPASCVNSPKSASIQNFKFLISIFIGSINNYNEKMEGWLWYGSH